MEILISTGILSFIQAVGNAGQLGWEYNKEFRKLQAISFFSMGEQALDTGLVVAA